MKIRTTYLIAITSLILFSCGKENKKGDEKSIVETKMEGNYISKIWKSTKDLFIGSESNIKSSTQVKKEKGNYISKKWKTTKEIFIESDSVIKARKVTYFADLNKKYSEFKFVQHWFASKSKELQNLQGEFYKMIKGTTVNNETISYNDLASISPQGTYKYLLISDDAFYIYDLSVNKGIIKCKGVRRIKKGMSSEPMHDLIFDKNGNLKQEIFQGDVEQDLFTKEGHIFFKFEKEYEGKMVTNTIDLGVERKF